MKNRFISKKVEYDYITIYYRNNNVFLIKEYIDNLPPTLIYRSIDWKLYGIYLARDDKEE